MGTTLNNIYNADPDRRRRGKRYTSGAVVSIAGGMVELDVGAKLPDGTAQNLKIPVASGFSPATGQMVSIIYPNDNPASAYAAAMGSASSVAPPSGTHALNDHTGTLANNRLANPNAVFCLNFHVASVGAGVTSATKQALGKNKSGVALTVIGIVVSARAKAGTADPTVDVYEGAASVLSSAVTLAATETAYEATIGDALIANNGEISIRCTTDSDGSIGELHVEVWCKAAHIG